VQGRSSGASRIGDAVTSKTKPGIAARLCRLKSRRLFCPTSQARRAKIFIFPKYSIYDLKKPARLDTGDVMAIRHQT
jgi:hypothetical protein